MFLQANNFSKNVKMYMENSRMPTEYSTLALKPREDITRSPKQAQQERTGFLQKFKVYVAIISGHPERVSLGVGFNSLQCDSMLCWVKQAESDWWMGFWENMVNHLSPECENCYELPWKDVNLHCAQA